MRTSRNNLVQKLRVPPHRVGVITQLILICKDGHIVNDQQIPATIGVIPPLGHRASQNNCSEMVKTHMCTCMHTQAHNNSHYIFQSPHKVELVRRGNILLDVTCQKRCHLSHMGTSYKQVTAQGTATSSHLLKESVMLGALLEKKRSENSRGTSKFKLQKSMK